MGEWIWSVQSIDPMNFTDTIVSRPTSRVVETTAVKSEAFGSFDLLRKVVFKRLYQKWPGVANSLTKRPTSSSDETVDGTVF